MPFVEAASYHDLRFAAPSGAAEFSPRREPWVCSVVPPTPSSAGRGEGYTRGWGTSFPGLSPWVIIFRPSRGLVLLTSRIIGAGDSLFRNLFWLWLLES